VRLLFDQNLSHRLVEELAPWFPDGAHVRALGLDTATDREIWTYAGEHGDRQAPSSGVQAVARFAVSEEEALLVLPNLVG
jgi:hypothetical protein